MGLFFKKSSQPRHEISPPVSESVIDTVDGLLSVLSESRATRQKLFISPLSYTWESFQKKAPSNYLLAAFLGALMALPLGLAAYAGMAASFSFGAAIGTAVGVFGLGAAAVGSLIHKGMRQTVQKRYQTEQDTYNKAKATWQKTHRTLRHDFFPDFNNDLIADLLAAKEAVHRTDHAIVLSAEKRKDNILKTVATGAGGLAVLVLHLMGASHTIPIFNTIIGTTFSSVLFYGTVSVLTFTSACSVYLENQNLNLFKEHIILDEANYAERLQNALAAQSEKTALRKEISVIAQQKGQDPAKYPLLARLFQMLALRQKKLETAHPSTIKRGANNAPGF